MVAVVGEPAGLAVLTGFTGVRNPCTRLPRLVVGCGPRLLYLGPAYSNQIQVPGEEVSDGRIRRVDSIHAVLDGQDLELVPKPALDRLRATVFPVRTRDGEDHAQWRQFIRRLIQKLGVKGPVDGTELDKVLEEEHQVLARGLQPDAGFTEQRVERFPRARGEAH